MAAFALGLIGDAAAAPALMTALGRSPIRAIQGRAAEALGLIGHKPAAPARSPPWSRRTSRAGALARWRRTTTWAIRRRRPSRPCASASTRWCGWRRSSRCAAAVLDADGQPRSRWWPVAFALQRVDDPRGAPLRAAGSARGDGQLTRAFAARGLGALKDSESRATARGAGRGRRAQPLAVRMQAVRALGADRRCARSAPCCAALARRRSTQNAAARGDDARSAQLRDPAHGRAADRLLVTARGRRCARPRWRRWREPTPTRSSARLRASIPTRTGRCARRWPRRSASLARSAATARLTRLLRDPRSAGASRRSLDALAKAERPRPRERLTGGLGRSDPAVRVAAASGLATLEARRARPQRSPARLRDRATRCRPTSRAPRCSTR